MSKRSRAHTWLAVGVLAVGLFITAIAGLFVYMSATARPLHPDAQAVPMNTVSISPAWMLSIEQARQLAKTALVDQNLPGLSVAVGVRGELVWSEGVGWADLDARLPVTPGTRFRLGSGAIPLTAAAVGLLLEKGQLNLDEQVHRYVPSFPDKPWPVTLRQVMAHTAGIRNDGGDEGPLFGTECASPIDALEAFVTRDLLFEPGTRYRFSSFGWILLSAAIEAAAQEPFLSFMRHEIFDPVGMVDTKPDSATEVVANRATPYFPRFAADPKYGPDISRPINLSCYAGAGAFLSTPTDLVRFGMAINGGTLLRPETVKLLQSRQRLASGEETGYGLGWDFETVEVNGVTTEWVGHDGLVLGGPVASLVTFPDHGVVVAVMSNTSYADSESLAVRVAKVFLAGKR